jgi:hypothetical protein
MTSGNRKIKISSSVKKELIFRPSKNLIENSFKGLQRKNNKNVLHVYSFQVLFFVFHIINKLFKLRSNLTKKNTLSMHFRNTLSYNRLFIY